MRGIRTMILVILAALAAVCCADKLDKAYLPPVSAKTAGGDSGSLQAPFTRTFEQGSAGLPSGSYTNEYQGVIVDAVNPGTRASGAEQTGLGGPRYSYGSTNSKVGEAAFTESGSVNSDEVASFRIAPGFESFVASGDSKTEGSNFRIAPGFGDSFTAEGAVLTKDKNSNALKYSGAESDNGSYDTQKYNSAGDYSDSNNGNKYNDRQPSIGDKGFASGSFVTQNDQTGSNAPVVSNTQENKYSSQGSKSGSQFGTTASSFTSSFGQADQASKTQFGYKPQFTGSNAAQSSLDSQVNTGSNFGVPSGSPFGSQFSFNKGSKTQGSFGKVNYGTPGFSSASAETSGTGSATAFAQSGGDSGTKYPTKQSFSEFQGLSYPSNPSFATASASVTDSPYESNILQYTGSPQTEAVANVQPGQVTSFASAQNAPQQFPGSTYSQLSGFGNAPVTGKPQGVSSSFPTSATATASLSPQPGNFGGNSQPQYGSFYSQSGRPGEFGSGSGYGIQSQNTKVKPGQYSQGSGSYNQFTNGISSPTTSEVAKPSQISSGLSSFNQKPTNAPDTELATPFGPTEKPISSFSSQESNKFGSAQLLAHSPSPSYFGSTPKPQTSQFGSSGFQTTYSQGNSGLYSSNSFGSSQINPSNSPFTSTNQKPINNQEQDKDNSYYYNRPNKPFGTPTKIEGSKYSNTPASISPTSATQTSYYNGVTQAAASGFPSSSPTPNTQFGTQFGISKPSFVSQSSTGTQQNLDKKPFVQSQSKPTSSFGQSPVNKNPQIVDTQEYQGTIYEYNKPAEVLPTPSSELDKLGQVSTGAQLSQGSTQFSSQTSKPVSSTSTFQQSSQTTSGSPLSSQFVQKPTLTTFGQKPFGTSQASSSYPQSQFGSSTGLQFTQKPQSTAGASFTSSGQSQYGQKPFGSSLSSTFLQNQFGSSQSSNQLGQKPTSVAAGQTTQFSSKPVGSQDFSFQQNQLGTSTGSQVGESGLQQSQVTGQSQTTGSSFTTSTVSQGQSFQPEEKPGESTSTGTLDSQKTQFASTTGSQFTQTPTTSSQSTVTTVNQKPFGSSQSTGSYQQNQYGSSTGYQFDKKPQITQGFTSTSNSKGQAVQTTQFGAKPSLNSQTFGTTFQQSQFGLTGSTFGQKPSTQGSGFSIGTGSSQSGLKPFASTTNSKGQTVQTTQFGQKPLGSSHTSGTSFQQSQFGSTFGQKPSTQGSSFSIGAGSSQLVQKPFGSTDGSSSNFQQGQFGSNIGSQYGSTPTSGSQTNVFTVQQNQATSTGSQFIKKPQNTFQQTQYGTSGSTFNFNQKPQTGFSIGTQTTQKPFGSSQTGSISQQNQFSTSSTGSKGQIVQNSQFGQKPFSSSQFSGFTQQNQYTNTYGTTFGQKPQKTQGSAFSITNSKPFGIAQTSGSQQTQYGSTTGSQFGQKPFGSSSSSISTLGQKPFSSSSIGTSLQQTEFGTTSQFDKKPEVIQETGTNTAKKEQVVPTTQFGETNIVSTNSNLQNQLGSTGSQFNQKPQTASGNDVTSTTSTQTAQSSHLGQKPFSNSLATSSFQQNQFGSSGSQYGKIPSQGSNIPVFTSQFPISSSRPQIEIQSQKPFGSAQSTQGSGFQQTQFGSSLFGTQSSKYSQTQFGSQTQKPFGYQTVFPQNKFGSLTGQYGLKPQTSSASSFASTTGTATKFTTKPFESSQSNSGSKFSIGSLAQKPFGGTQTQQSQFTSTASKFGQSQTGQGSQTFGAQTQKPFGSTPLTQTSLAGSSESQKPFESTASAQKTQQTLSKIQATNVPTSSAQSSVQTGSYSTGGYLYQKPASSFISQFGTQTSQPLVDQKLQPSQASAFASASQPNFGSQTSKPFEIQGSDFQTTLNPIQNGFQSTEGPELGSTFKPQYTSGPFSSSTAQVTSFQPTLTSIPQVFKPFGAAAQGTSFGQSTSTFGNSVFGTPVQETVQSSQGSKFGQSYGTQLPFFQTTLGPSVAKPESSATATAESSVGSTQIGQSFGAGGEFGAPRDPPKFDEQTGYHY